MLSELCPNTLETKVVRVEQAVRCVDDRSVVAISGFNMATTPEYLIVNLYKRYRDTGHPKELFIVSDALPAVPDRGLDLVARDMYQSKESEFIRGILIPYLGFSPWLQKLVNDNLIEAYAWPLGIVAYWFREVASGRPGVLTKIGLGTYLDPRIEGGALNQIARERSTCRIDVITIEGDEYLFYRAPKPTYALIRGSTADEFGNLTLEDEGIKGTVLNIAQAVKARPDQGIVIAQVRWITRVGSLNPRIVEVPGPLVDYVVPSPKEYHWQAGSFEYDPRVSHRVIPPIYRELIEAADIDKPRDFEIVIARRALLEILKILRRKRPPAVVNLGVGIPALISRIAIESNVSSLITPVIESGPWGGLALTGINFGLAISPYALTTIPDTFSIFEGGVIDVAALGFLQVDSKGNVNPSALPGRIPGPGGFPVIAGGSPKIIFAGGFTAGKRDIRVEDGKLKIVRDGDIVKFVDRVYKIFFNGEYALKYGKEVTYITERAVFKLTDEGLQLVEVAPDIDIEKHILSKMEFKPIIGKVDVMDKEIFRDKPIDMRALIDTYI